MALKVGFRGSVEGRVVLREASDRRRKVVVAGACDVAWRTTERSCCWATDGEDFPWAFNNQFRTGTDTGWLRTNAGGRLNTCKSQEKETSVSGHWRTGE